jgi:lipid-binding SYLF domain-containing protein
MKSILRNTILVPLLLAAVSSTFTACAEDLEAKSTEAVQNFKKTDPGLTKFFDKAAGYAILPSVGEGGFIIGGQRGDGLVYEKDKLVGKVTMSEVSLGAQVGGGSFAELIFFETPEALKDFQQSQWVMSAKAKAAVAASGVAENAKYDQGVAIFTLPKSGVMVAAALGGQKFKYEAIKK